VDLRKIPGEQDIVEGASVLIGLLKGVGHSQVGGKNTLDKIWVINITEDGAYPKDEGPHLIDSRTVNSWGTVNPRRKGEKGKLTRVPQEGG